jgi:hypothetical protein
LLKKGAPTTVPIAFQHAANDANALRDTGARALAHDRGYLVPSLDGEPYEPLPGRAVGAQYDQFHGPFIGVKRLVELSRILWPSRPLILLTPHTTWQGESNALA